MGSKRGQTNPSSLANLRPPPAPEKGNQRAATHGGFARIAPARLEQQEQEVFDALAADAPVRDSSGGLPAADTVVVSLLAETLCRLSNVREWIAENGVFDTRRFTSTDPKKQRDKRRKQRTRARKDPMRVVEVEARLRREALDYAESLGMTPRSRARLGLDMARTADLANAMSEEDPQRRAELMREAGVPMEGEAVNVDE